MTRKRIISEKRERFFDELGIESRKELRSYDEDDEDCKKAFFEGYLTALKFVENAEEDSK